MAGNPPQTLMNPLYCFKLDEQTGEITRLVIENYSKYQPSPFVPSRVFYTFVINNYRHDLNSKNLDRCVNWRYYTFEDNLDKVKQEFISDLRNKITKAKKDLFRYSNAYENILGGLSGDEKNRNILSI